jgi:hypothetical protein
MTTQEFSIQSFSSTTQGCRFEVQDVLHFSTNQLRLLQAVSPSIICPDKDVVSWCSFRSITKLRPAERAVVSVAMSKKFADEVIEPADVHGYYLKRNPTYFSKDGLVVEMVGADKQKVVCPPAPWTVPADLIKNYPGIQQIVAMTITCVKSTADGLVNIVDADQLKFYQQVKFTGFDPNQLGSFAEVMIDQLKPMNLTHNGTGRTFIEKLFVAFGRMPQTQYLMMHWTLNKGPLAKCFEWGIRNGNSIKKATYNFQKDEKWVIVKIREGYEKSFANAATTPGAKQISQELYDLGTLFPILVGPLPIKYQAPIIKDMYSCHSLMNACRQQRQADEKGLSAMSSGYGASGNPTKSQLRYQKMLTLILGSMMSHTHRIIIISNKMSELEFLNLQIKQWIEKKPKGFFKTEKYVFQVPPYSGKGEALKGNVTTSTAVQSGDLILDLSSTAAESISKDNYAKTDSTVMATLKERLPKTKVEAASANIHYIVLKHIQSEQMFYSKNLEQVESGYYIYSLGSVHNMHGIVSTLPQLTVASCSGVGEWEIAAEKLTPKDVTTFWKAVTDHNLGRSAFFLAGKYHFNPMLNAIRRIPGKAMDWVAGELVDNGIDIEANLEALGDLEEGPEATEDSPTPGKKLNVSQSSNSSNVDWVDQEPEDDEVVQSVGDVADVTFG